MKQDVASSGEKGKRRLSPQGGKWKERLWKEWPMPLPSCSSGCSDVFKEILVRHSLAKWGLCWCLTVTSVTQTSDCVKRRRKPWAITARRWRPLAYFDTKLNQMRLWRKFQVRDETLQNRQSNTDEMLLLTRTWKIWNCGEGYVYKRMWRYSGNTISFWLFVFRLSG